VKLSNWHKSFEWLKSSWRPQSARLAQEVQEYRSLVDGLPCLVCCFRPLGLITYVNRAYCEYFGKSPEQLIGSSFLRLVPEQDHDRILIELKQLTSQSPACTVEHMVIAKDGSSRWQRWTNHAHFGPDGSLEIVYSFGEDIPDGKRAENELDQARTRYQEIFKGIQEGIGIVDENETFVFANPAFASILEEESAEALIGRSILDYLPDDQRAFVLEQTAKRRERLTSQYELSIVTRKGTCKTILVSVSPRLDTDGRFIGSFGAIMDVTDRKRAEGALRVSEALNRAVIENSPVGISIRSAQGKLLSVNSAWMKIWGLSPEGVENYKRTSTTEFICEPNRKQLGQWLPQVESVYRTGGILNIPELHYCDDPPARPRWVSLTYYSLMNDQGEVDRVVILTEDVTERKQAEETLRFFTHRLSLASEAAGIGVWDLDLKTNHLVWDDRMYEMYGVSASDFGGAYETWQKSVHPDDLDHASREVSEAISNTRDFHTSFRIVVPDGRVRHIEAHALVLRSLNGTPDRMVGVNLDITERRQAEEALRKSESFNRAVVENSPVGISIRNVTGQLLSVNDAWMKIWGVSPEAVEHIKNEGMNDLTGGPKRRQLGQWFPQIENICRNGGVLRIPELYYEDDPPARSRWVSFTYYSIMNNQGEVERVVILTEDITERKLAEEALSQSEEKYRSYVDNSPDGIFVFDTAGHLLEANPAAERMTGYTRAEILIKTIDDFFPQEWRETSQQHFVALQDSGHYDGEIPIRRRDGVTVWWATNVVRFDENRFLGFAVDVTDTRRLRELESRAQRLETAGRVAGQVAHDFNNLLAPLMAYPDFIREELPRNHPALAYLGSMEEAAQRIAEINQQLLTLGRRGHYNQEPLNLNEVVQQVLVETEYPRATLTCQTDLATDLMNVMAGRAQIYRVLMNLFQNARDAMGDIGRLTIRTENFHADHAATVFCRVPEGEYVKLTVSDTGCGIPDDVMPKIFDPFFTTKITDGKRGSGLGLSVVDAVMKDHGGYVDVRSKIGEGTSIYLYFPVTLHACDETERANVSGGNELVLVVDDDSVQRDVTLKLLSRLGYLTDSAASGEEALEKLRSQPVDLLVLDMILPSGIDGAETYRRALEIIPAQRAIIVSGFAESDRVSVAQQLGAGAFVLKPLTRAALAQAVRRELDHNATETVKA
jgi:PAS domain S-box-containing protein